MRTVCGQQHLVDCPHNSPDAHELSPPRSRGAWLWKPLAAYSAESVRAMLAQQLPRGNTVGERIIALRCSQTFRWPWTTRSSSKSCSGRAWKEGLILRGTSVRRTASIRVSNVGARRARDAARHLRYTQPLGD